MKHLKVYDTYDYISYNHKKYMDFILEKFRLDKKPYGGVEYAEINDLGIKIYIRIGGDINPLFLKGMIEFFEDCDGYISVPHTGDFIYYNLTLSYNFLKKLDIEIDAKKYNI